MILQDFAESKSYTRGYVTTSLKLLMFYALIIWDNVIFL